MIVQMTQQEKQHVKQMRQYMRRADEVYAEENRLAEKILTLLLHSLAKCGPASADIPRYLQALRLQDRLLCTEEAYQYGKHAACCGTAVAEGFAAYLSAVYCGAQAAATERELWRCYRRIARKMGVALLDELTELVRDLHSRSGELMLEVFEAGYIAGLQQKDAAGEDGFGQSR
ncbi:MAG: hypothetical protein ACOX6U_00765 [Oscillospiraceae bacterium]|jgi:hypothetical protein